MPHETMRSGIDETRALIALVGSLEKDGDTVDAHAVALRLGISHERAQHLLDLLMMAGGDSFANTLPLSNGDSSVTLRLAFARGTRGRGLRLTEPEYEALEAAFDAMGTAPDDELRRKVERAFAPLGVGARQRVTEGAAGREAQPQTLAALSRAILAKKVVTFDYRVPGQAPSLRRRSVPLVSRHVAPLSLEHEGDLWYLRSWDLDRREGRTFRTDRMDRVTVTDDDIPEVTPADAEGAGRDERTVTLTFTNKHLLDLFDWPGMRVTRRRGDVVTCTIPWYEHSQWLPRRIAACGSGVGVDDAALRNEVIGYVYDLLDRLAATSVG